MNNQAIGFKNLNIVKTCAAKALIVFMAMILAITLMPTQAHASWGKEKWVEHWGNWWLGRSACYNNLEQYSPGSGTWRSNGDGYVWTRMPEAEAPTGWLRNRIKIYNETTGALTYEWVVENNQWPHSKGDAIQNNGIGKGPWNQQYQSWRVIGTHATFAWGKTNGSFTTYACWQGAKICFGCLSEARCTY